MKFTRRDAAKLLALPVLFHASKQVFPEAAAASRTDPAFREAVQAAMLEYIDAAKIKGYSLIFDPIKGGFVKARFKKLHNNLSLVADSFYVSCADYETEDGKLPAGCKAQSDVLGIKVAANLAPVLLSWTSPCPQAQIGLTQDKNIQKSSMPENQDLIESNSPE